MADTSATRRALLDAAVDEFSSAGIAGARVDRIAARAGFNKALLYSYFGNKEQLFQHAADHLLGSLVDDVPFDGDDPADYAARLFDHLMREPRIFRLAMWDRLERGGAGLAGEAGHTAAKLERLERAQATGAVSREFAPDELLVLILATASAWFLTGEPTPGTPEAARARDAVRRVIRRLVAPQ